MSEKVEFARLVSILRVSSPNQLDFPAIHALAWKYIEYMFPSGPQPFIHTNPEEALAVATKYHIDSVSNIFCSSVAIVRASVILIEDPLEIDSERSLLQPSHIL
jgi:hypothetical protein